MRLLVPVVFWVGVAGIVWEFMYARKHREPITRTEKLYLVLVFPFLFFGGEAFELMGFPYDVVLPTGALCLAIALNAWVMKRRIQRRPSASEITEPVE